MKDTSEVIAQLADQAAPVKALPAAHVYAGLLVGVSLLYLVVAQFFLGVRPDLYTQLTRSVFVAELLALFALSLSSIYAALILMRPDGTHYQAVLKIPYLALCALAACIALQWMMPLDARMVSPAFSLQGRECALCIALLSLVPSAVLFSIVRKGASTQLARAGWYVVLASSAIGCITQRIAEMNDALSHLLVWHYLPTLAFAALGAWLGKRLLAW